VSAASSTPGGGGPGAKPSDPHRWGRRITTGVFLGPAAALLAVWLVYPTIATIYRSFFDRSGDKFVWFRNYGDIFSTDNLVRALENNALWVAVVPALVTAIGLILAVLTEKIRWQVAFRLAIFMPMAISLFAAGVIWRIMDARDPGQGTINATINTVRSAFTEDGPLPQGRPSKPDAFTGSQAAGWTLKAKVPAGGSALLGLTAIPPAMVPTGAKQAVTPAANPKAITGTVWRDFKPGGGEAGVVESGELGIPGATVELRDGAKVVQTQKTGDDGGFSFGGVGSGTDYTVAISKKTFSAPYAGVSWLGPKLITPAVMIAYIWVWAGFAMVIIAAGLASISREVLEAARTDGATEWQVFRRVTAPMLAPVLSVVFITMLINVLKVFDIVLSVAPASSQDDANVIALAMWRTSFSGANNFGLGSAIAVLLLLLVLPALALNVRRFRREQ
jgi:alpha-glucoside transport system permease protein